MQPLTQKIFILATKYKTMSLIKDQMLVLDMTCLLMERLISQLLFFTKWTFNAGVIFTSFFS